MTFHVVTWLLVLPADIIPTGVDRIYLISCRSLPTAFAACRRPECCLYALMTSHKLDSSVETSLLTLSGNKELTAGCSINASAHDMLLLKYLACSKIHCVWVSQQAVRLNKTFYTAHFIHRYQYTVLFVDRHPT